MAKVGRTTARWLKEYTDAEGQKSRKHYALRVDGKLLVKDSVYQTPTYSQPGWHDWGWHLTKVVGKSAAEIDALLLPKGFTREGR